MHGGCACSKDLGLDVLGPRIHHGPKRLPLSTLNPTANVFPRHPGSPSRGDTLGRGPQGDMGVGKCREGERLEETQGEHVTAPVPLWGQPRLAQPRGAEWATQTAAARSQELSKNAGNFGFCVESPNL